MKITPIWDSTTRYRTFRLEDAERQPASQFGPAYTPQRLRLTYNDPQSDGNWRLVMADIEGHEFAPVSLHFKEPLANELRSYQLLDWVPVWVAKIALRATPGGDGPDPDHDADLGVRPFEPTDPLPPAIVPASPPQPYPFQFPRPFPADPVPPVVVTVDTKPVTDKPGHVGTTDVGQPWVDSSAPATPPPGTTLPPDPSALNPDPRTFGQLNVPPGEYSANFTVDEKDPTNPSLFKVAEVRALNGQSINPPITWGAHLGQTSEEASQGAAEATQRFAEANDATALLPRREVPHGA